MDGLGLPSAVSGSLAWQSRITVCPASDLPQGTVSGAEPYAVRNIDGKYFAGHAAVSASAPGDLAGGSIEDGRLVCPWHQAAYDVEDGPTVRAPKHIFAKIPGTWSDVQEADVALVTRHAGTVSVSGNHIVVEYPAGLRYPHCAHPAIREGTCRQHKGVVGITAIGSTTLPRSGPPTSAFTMGAHSTTSPVIRLRW